MQAAVDAYRIRKCEKISKTKKNGKTLSTPPTSICRIATEFVVDYKTLRKNIPRAISRPEAEKLSCKLIKKEEKVIVQQCPKVTDLGWPLGVTYVKEMAEAIVPDSELEK